uniref:F-box domain-containing protein n=1 Tax=Oryza brachyantha TaxID=4533 RepID=J3N645_ORYBR
MLFCRLLSHGDRRRVRAVCRGWHVAARQKQSMVPSSLPPSLPWAAARTTTYQSLPDGEVHRFLDAPGTTVFGGLFDGFL